MILEKSVEYGVQFKDGGNSSIIRIDSKEQFEIWMHHYSVDHPRLVSRLVLKGEWGPDA